jgi:hypothetical protein
LTMVKFTCSIVYKWAINATEVLSDSSGAANHGLNPLPQVIKE